MFGLGMPEILMILAIALIVIGPKKLPDLAKTLGRAMGEFKRSAQDFKKSIDVDTTVRDFDDISLSRHDASSTIKDDTDSEITEPDTAENNSSETDSDSSSHDQESSDNENLNQKTDTQ